MCENPAILHELYVFSEWKPEPEYLQKPDNILPESISALWRWLRYFGAQKSLVDSINAYKKRLQKWHIALSNDSKVIAVVTDNILEIRTKRSEYATIAARTTVSRDAYSQWRQVVWSPDCAFLALAYGNGVVSFFDLTASNLFNIPFECSRPGGLECTDSTHAVASVIFMPLKVKDPKWNWEVLIISFDGYLRAYLVSQTDGYKLHNSFRFAGGVGAAAYCHAHNSLYIAGVPQRRSKDPRCSLSVGLTAWRVLNDEPHYKLSVVSDDPDSEYGPYVPFYVPFLPSKKEDFVVRMEIAPNYAKLVCLHCNGDVSLWHLPQLRLERRYPLPSQQEHDLRNPLLPAPAPSAPAAPAPDPALVQPADVNWWSDQEIILSRHSGAVTVNRTEDFVNLLGQDPQFFQGSPEVTRAHDGSFMILECETNVLPAKRSRSDESMEVVRVEADTAESMLEVSRELVKSLLYAITDMEAFQPRPRRITVLARIYRLLGVKSTTPTELFARQIESGRYSEALLLAETYGLDSDLVYQQQWRKNPVSVNSIVDYLCSMKDTTWAVHQCMDRLPESLLAAKQLLEFGLVLTNDKILEEANGGLYGPGGKKVEELTLSDLNAVTSELLRCRHAMLFYRRRLALYELILRSEKSAYNKDEYHRLRSNSLLYSATEIAKEGRVEALTCLWPHLRTTTMRLAVLENLPETINPLLYQHLLPNVDGPAFADRFPEVLSTEHDNDWCKKEIFRSIWSSNWSEETSPEADAGAAGAGGAERVEAEELGAWYARRARSVEARSGLASHALTLARLAPACAARALHDVLFHLLTLDTLLYDINLEDVTLAHLENISVPDTCHLLMKKSTPATFVSDLKEYIIPFLNRYGKLTGSPDFPNSGFIEYLKSISVDDLSYILLVVKARKEFDMGMDMQLEMVEKCLYAHTRTDQLDVACELLDTILKDRDESYEDSSLVRRVGYLERLVAACSRLAWRGVRVPLAALRERAHCAEHAAQLLADLATAVYTQNEKPTPNDWQELLTDIIGLQTSLFECLPMEKCYEIYALALLTSGSASSIRLASEVLARPGEARPRTVPHARAAELVLDAARDYVDSASSLTDPALEHARCCLILIEDRNNEIEMEMDLISSLKILHSFNVSMLPVEVRLCENRLKLIEQCLESDPNAYMASHKLLTLAKLLRVADDDEQLREGQVLQLVGSRAVRAGAAGGAAAAAAARRLAALRHAPAAPLLARVAQAPAPADTAARRLLLAAALAHCPPADLHRNLRLRLKLELESMQAAGAAMKESNRITSRWPSTDDEFSDAVTTPIIEKKDLVAPEDEREEKKDALFSYLLDAFQNKFTLSGSKAASDEPEPEVACQEFYLTLYPELRVSEEYYRYDRFALPGGPAGQAACHAVLAWYYTQGCLEDCTNELEPEVTQRCGYAAVRADTALGVACLARAARARAPPAPPAALAAASAAAALYAALLHCAAPALKDSVYLAPPVQLARLALRCSEAGGSEGGGGDEGGGEGGGVGAGGRRTAQARQCAARLGALGEAGRLRALGLPVNSLLFNADADYRQEAIYSLARLPGQEQWELAYKLARKYSLDVVELWLQRAAAPTTITSSTTTTSSSVPSSAVAAMTMPPELRTPQAYARVREALWPEIAGSDHAALINYFTILRNIDEKPLIHGLTAAEHIKLLKKAKAASPELNYKLVLEQGGAEQLTAHALDIIRPENVGMLAKFLRTLPPAFKVPLPVNQLYTMWLTKYFFSVGNASGLAPSSKKWMQQYRQCASYFNKLGKDDLLTFVNNTCFTADALARVPSGTRNLMIMQAVDYCQQEQENDIKFNKNEQSWAGVANELARWARFLENCHSPAVRALRGPDDPAHEQAWMELEMSHGEAGRVAGACARLALGGALRAGALGSLLHCLHAPLDAPAALAHALHHCTHTPADMETLVARVTQFHKEGVKFGEEFLEQVVERAGEFAVPPHKLLGLLALSRRALPPGAALADVARSTADLFRTEWPDCEDQLTEEALQSEAGRREAFGKFAARCDTWQRKKALVDVLNCWPRTPTQESRSLQSEFMLSLLREPDRKEALVLIKMLQRALLTDEEVKWLAESAEDNAVVNAIWIVLLNKCEHSDELVCNLAVKHKDAILKEEIEEEMIQEMLDQGMFIKLVSTPLYSSIINYIMSRNSSSGEPSSPYTVQWATAELLKANYIAEAGHLKLLCIGAPSPLRGFTQSVLYYTQNV